LEKLFHIADVVGKYTSSNGRVKWSSLTEEFVGQWYHQQENLKKAVTIIKALNKQPEVILIFILT
jgi:hypothetical protein